MTDTSTPLQSTADKAQQGSYLQDPELSSLLSRLAALQGVALPVHRFSMMSTSAMGSAVDQLSRPQRAIEWWMSALPNGVATEIEGLTQSAAAQAAAADLQVALGPAVDRQRDFEAHCRAQAGGSVKC